VQEEIIMALTRVNTERKKKIDALKAAMKFCPECGKPLKKLGSPSSEIMTCPDMHGELRVTGSQQNSKIQMIFTHFEE
jgi:transposase